MRLRKVIYTLVVLLTFSLSTTITIYAEPEEEEFAEDFYAPAVNKEDLPDLEESAVPIVMKDTRVQKDPNDPTKEFQVTYVSNEALVIPNITYLHSVNAAFASTGRAVYYLPSLEDFPIDLATTCHDLQNGSDKYKFAVVYGGDFDEEVKMNVSSEHMDTGINTHLQTSKKVYSEANASRCCQLIGYDILLTSEYCDIHGNDENLCFWYKPTLAGSAQLDCRTAVMDIYKALGEYEYDIQVVHGNSANPIQMEHDAEGPDSVPGDYINLSTSPVLSQLGISFLLDEENGRVRIHQGAGSTWVWCSRTNPAQYWEKCERDAIFDGGIHKGQFTHYLGNECSVSFSKQAASRLNMSEFMQIAYAMMNLYGEPVLVEDEINLLLQAYSAYIPSGLSEDEEVAFKYLAAKGIIDPTDIDLTKNISFADIEDILVRIADEGSRLTIKSEAVLNQLLQKNNFSRAKVASLGPVSDLQEITDPSTTPYNDYFIELNRETAFYVNQQGGIRYDNNKVYNKNKTISLNDGVRSTRTEKNLAAASGIIVEGVDPYGDDYYEYCGIETIDNIPYYHIRLDRNVTGSFSLMYDASDDPTLILADEEKRVEIPEGGGGVYNFHNAVKKAKTALEDTDVVITTQSPLGDNEAMVAEPCAECTRIPFDKMDPIISSKYVDKERRQALGDPVQIDKQGAPLKPADYTNYILENTIVDGKHYNTESSTLVYFTTQVDEATLNKSYYYYKKGTGSGITIPLSNINFILKNNMQKQWVNAQDLAGNQTDLVRFFVYKDGGTTTHVIMQTTETFNNAVKNLTTPSIDLNGDGKVDDLLPYKSNYTGFYCAEGDGALLVSEDYLLDTGLASKIEKLDDNRYFIIGGSTSNYNNIVIDTAHHYIVVGDTLMKFPEDKILAQEFDGSVMYFASDICTGWVTGQKFFVADGTIVPCSYQRCITLPSKRTSVSSVNTFAPSSSFKFGTITGIADNANRTKIAGTITNVMSNYLFVMTKESGIAQDALYILYPKKAYTGTPGKEGTNPLLSFGQDDSAARSSLSAITGQSIKIPDNYYLRQINLNRNYTQPTESISWSAGSSGGVDDVAYYGVTIADPCGDSIDISNGYLLGISNTNYTLDSYAKEYFEGKHACPFFKNGRSSIYTVLMNMAAPTKDSKPYTYGTLPYSMSSNGKKETLAHIEGVGLKEDSETFNYSSLTLYPAPVGVFSQLKGINNVRGSSVSKNATLCYGTSVLKFVDPKYKISRIITNLETDTEFVPAYMSGGKGNTYFALTDETTIGAETALTKDTYKFALTDPDLIVDWDAYTFDRLVENLDDWTSILLLIVLTILPRFFILLFFALILLSLIVDFRAWRNFCNNVFDVYSFLTFGKLNVNTVETKRLVLVSCIAIACFLLVCDGTLFKIMIWISKWFIVLFQK